MLLQRLLLGTALLAQAAFAHSLPNCRIKFDSVLDCSDRPSSIVDFTLLMKNTYPNITMINFDNTGMTHLPDSKMMAEAFPKLEKIVVDHKMDCMYLRMWNMEFECTPKREVTIVTSFCSDLAADPRCPAPPPKPEPPPPAAPKEDADDKPKCTKPPCPEDKPDTLDLSAPLVTVPFRNFQTRIFKDTDEKTGEQYYHTAACTLYPNSSQILLNNETHEHFVLISLRLWDTHYLQTVQRLLSENVGHNITALQLIPFHSMRMFFMDNAYSFNMLDQWVTIIDKPAEILVRLVCISEKNCWLTKNFVLDHPAYFASTLGVTFSLNKPLSKKKVISVTHENLWSSPLFDTVLQRHSVHSHKVCVQEADLRQILNEALTSALDAALLEEEFVSGDQYPHIITDLFRALKTKPANTRSFTEDSWKSVFWKDESTRPDEKFRNMLSSLGHNSKLANALRTMFRSGNDGLDTLKITTDSQSQMELNSIVFQMKDNPSGLLTWNGNAFVVKPVTLYCLNLTLLHSQAVIGNVTVIIGPKYGHLSGTVNVLPEERIRRPDGGPGKEHGGPKKEHDGHHSAGPSPPTLAPWNRYS